MMTMMMMMTTTTQKLLFQYKNFALHEYLYLYTHHLHIRMQYNNARQKH